VGASTAVLNWGDDRLATYFWERTQPCPMTGCWIWTGPTTDSKSPNGTAQVPVGRLNDRKSGSIRKQLHVLLSSKPQRQITVTCGLDLCCNPAHFRLKRSAEERRKHGRELKRARLYGISPSQFRALLETQRGECGICRNALSDNGNDPHGINVDHCHSTGAVRGLLCNRCNPGIGYFRDNVETLRSAIDYLERHKKDAA
jgi:hypothetical protein